MFAFAFGLIASKWFHDARQHSNGLARFADYKSGVIKQLPYVLCVCGLLLAFATSTRARIHICLAIQMIELNELQRKIRIYCLLI